jgi:hypothetical protein
VSSSVAAWRVTLAQRAEHNERQKAEAANRDLRQAIRLLELERAEGFFQAGDPASGAAHLAAILRRDPSNAIAANRLVSALVHRPWALPAAPPIRHPGPVEIARFSPDGRLVLTASRDNTARLSDALTSLTIATVRHKDRIFSALFSPDGACFVTASTDGTARIWSATNRAPLTPPLRHTGKAHWAGLRPITSPPAPRRRSWPAGRP